MIIRFDEEFKVESILAEDSINAGNNLTNEIKVFMPATFDINSHKGYVNFKLSDGKEYNNLVMERVNKANETNSSELCYYYSLPKFLTKQKGPLYLSIRLSPINNTNVIANTGVIKTEVYYAIIDNGEEVVDPTTVDQIRKEIAESESSLKLFVEETIKDGYDLRVVGTVDSVNDLPKNLTSNDVGESYYVGITYPRDVYTWGYLNNMELGWSNQGPLKILSDDPVLQFAKSEYDKSLNKANINFETVTISGVTCTLKDGFPTLNGTCTADYFFIEINDIYLDGQYTLTNFTENYTNEIGLVSDWSVIFNDNAPTNTFSGNINKIWFYNTKGYVFDNTQIKLMLVEGDKKSTEYYSYNGEIVHEAQLESLLNKLEIAERTKQYSFKTNASDSLLLNIDEIIYDLTDSRFQLKIEGIRNGGGTTFSLISVNARNTDSYTLTVTSLGSNDITATFDYTTQNLTINGLGAWGIYTINIISL